MQATGIAQKTRAVCEAIWPMMAHHHVDVYLVPSSDEHLNEYLPEAHKRREYLSGFSGSAGDALVLSPDLQKAASDKPVWIFADSRYYEQADLEVDLATVAVSKVGVDGHPQVLDKLLQLGKKKSGLRVGFDPFTLSHQTVLSFEKQFESANMTLVPVSVNLVDAAWASERPQDALAPVYALPEKYTGKSAADKIERLQRQLKEAQCAMMPVTKLDQIAWLLNLRGQDIPYNPVFMAYVIIQQDEVLFFCEGSRIEAEAKAALPGQVKLLPYRDYARVLAERATTRRVLIDPKHTTYGTVHTLMQCNATIVTGENPIEQDKAIKNETELQWMREAHIKSAKGKIRAFHWLSEQLSANKPVSEKSFADALETFYAEEEGYKGLSFNTIAGFAANSSIVHYGTPSEDVVLKPGELFLLDSGVQYLGGTTDDTRTVIIGEPTALQKKRFTEVLKAHINCAKQVFPKGTEGVRLDGITRANLWQLQMDYGHGTGHGVGAFLNVHEGPCGIHRLATKALLPGMVVSIEPGYYEPGWGGIRCENLYTVIEVSPGWYGFESLTYIPFDRNLVDESLLSPDQKDWLNVYHQQVMDKVGQKLPGPVQSWLAKGCQAF